MCGVIDVADDLRARIAGAVDREQAASLAVRELNRRMPHYSWVGIYWVSADGTELVLGPWVGPSATEHVRIPIGTGVCGAAAASGRTEVVDDVSRDPRYLECFPSTRSEIVVPIVRDGRVIGEIDVDSDRLAAFSNDDVRLLEDLARALASRG
jgi:L-methionine (R)-S-oxide reductase